MKVKKVVFWVSTGFAVVLPFPLSLIPLGFAALTWKHKED